MTSWTLRGGHPNRHGELHRVARRAVRQVRRHSLEFQGAGMAEATAVLPFTSADVHDVVAQIQAAFQAFRMPRLPELSPSMTTVEMVNLAKDSEETDG